MIDWLMNREIADCINLIQEMMVKNGIALNDVISDIHEEIAAIEFPDKIKANILMVVLDFILSLFNYHTYL